MVNKDLEVIDNMIGQLDQSHRWARVVTVDPMIQKSKSKLDRLLEKLPGEVEDAVSDYEGDIVRAAMLFGMWAMCELRDILNDPAQLGQYMLDRMEGRR